MNCYCGAPATFENCCGPILAGTKTATTPEQLMRSRYSAYATGQYDYVLQTYAEQQRKHLTLTELQNDAADTNWLALEVVHAERNSTPEKVEFKAYYQVEGLLFMLHEKSDFVLEENQWRYTSGHIFEDSGTFKPGRNDPCICGSGKKFKRCCGKG